MDININRSHWVTSLTHRCHDHPHSSAAMSALFSPVWPRLLFYQVICCAWTQMPGLCANQGLPWQHGVIRGWRGGRHSNQTLVILQKQKHKSQTIIISRSTEFTFHLDISDRSLTLYITLYLRDWHLYQGSEKDILTDIVFSLKHGWLCYLC